MTDGPVFCMNVLHSGKPYATGTDSCPPPPTAASAEGRKRRRKSEGTAGCVQKQEEDVSKKRKHGRGSFRFWDGEPRYNFNSCRIYMKRGEHLHMHRAAIIYSGRDVFLIREAVEGGERGGGAGLVHLSQAASLPVLLPPPRERSTAVTAKALLSRKGLALLPSTLHLSAQKHPCKRMKRTSEPSHCAVSLHVCNFKPL